MIDWNLWLRRYDNPRSAHSQRLRTVQRLIARRLDRLAPHPVSILSICAGDGRDIIQVLADRDDASRVEATLVECDPQLCAKSKAQASQHGLRRVLVKLADAGLTDTYVRIPPADLVILVGVLGNISDRDVKATMQTLPALCRRDALVIWSLRQQPRRDRPESDIEPRNGRERVEKVKGWFRGEGFEEAFSNRDDAAFHVGAHRYVESTTPLLDGHKFFTFDNLNEAKPA